MKNSKSLFGLFLMTLMLFTSCSKDNSAEDELLKVKVEPALTSEYYNFVAAKTDMSNVEFTKVNSLDADDIKYIEDENGVIFKSRTIDYAYNYDYATTTELNVEGRNLILHIIPFANVAYYNKAHVYIEDAGVISSDFLEISISDIDDGYKAEWTTIRTALVTKRECEDGIISCDCDEGSSDVRNLGTAIAAGGLFGCVPCAFVGGAIAALGAVGGLLCP